MKKTPSVIWPNGESKRNFYVGIYWQFQVQINTACFIRIIKIIHYNFCKSTDLRKFFERKISENFLFFQKSVVKMQNFDRANLDYVEKSY